MKKPNPFDECPVYETEHFTFGLVDENDAEDLFLCYTDPVTLSHVNNDNCSGEWRLSSPEQLRHAWQQDYIDRSFVRWSVRCKESGRAVGTIEMAPLPWGRWFFGEKKPIGIQRLDLLSAYEKENFFLEIIELMSSELASDFEVDEIIFKALPEESDKLSAVLKNGFTPCNAADFKYPHYYIKHIVVHGGKEDQ